VREEHVRLSDGTPAVIRPYDLAHPIPREALSRAYDKLSDETKYHRFLSAVPHLTETLLDHLVDEIDGVDHVVLLLAIEPEKGYDSIVGVGRIIRYPDRPEVADVAVTVRDEWQGRGGATALLAALARNRPPGVTQIDTIVSADNTASLKMLQRLGDCHVDHVGALAVRVTIDLPPVQESVA